MARPRNADSDTAVLAVATRHLFEEGFERLSVNAIAAEVGVAKTTVYRRWPTKAHLVIAVVASMQAEVEIQDSGDVVSDITSLISTLAKSLGAPVIRGIAAELVAAASRDDDLRQRFTDLWASRRAELERVIRAGIERGQLRETDPWLLIDQLIGPLYYRILVSGEPIDAGYASALVAATLRGLVVESGSAA